MNVKSSTIKFGFSALLFLAMIVGLAVPAQSVQAIGTTVYVDNLQPSWIAPGGGGVFSAYIGPPAYGFVSPGSTALYAGREAGIIKAGINVDADTHYWDEGLLAFKVNVGISAFASQALTYVVQNETGVNPVWVRIRLVSGTQYQFVPSPYTAGVWNTVDAAAGSWQLMDSNGAGTGPMMTLAEVATANPGATVDRVYLTMGMGDSYNVSPGVGTVAWVDMVTIDTVIYDFVIATPTDWYVAKTGLDTNEGTELSPFLTIQHAVDLAGAGDTIHVAAGTYVETGQIVISKNLTIVGANKTTTIIQPGQDSGNESSGDARGWFLVNSGVTFNLSNVTLDGSGKLIAIAILSHGNGTIENNIIKNIGYSTYYGRGIQLYDTNMTVRNNQLENIQRIGILAFGSGVTSAVIDGNTYVGKGAGDWLDYGIELGGGAVAEVMNNTVSGNTGIASVDGSTSAGVLVTTYFAAGTTGNVHDNIFSSNSAGIVVGFDGADTSTVIAHHNQFLGNGKGISSTAPAVNAEENWWGSVTGPGVVGPGTGDKVSTNVDYFPWCTNPACTTFAPPFATMTTITADTPDPSLINQTVTVTATVAGLPAGAPTPTGTVTISGGVADCTITLVNGTGSCGITFNTGGAKTITATYNPDTADFTGSVDTESHNIKLIYTTTSQGVNDGWVIESTEVSGTGGSLVSNWATFIVGDYSADRQVRSIISFDTSALPENAVVTKVTLKIRKQGVIGTDPFTSLGNLLVDIRRPYFGSGVGLALPDFQVLANRSAVGTFGAPTGNWYSARIGSAGYRFINLTGTTQFRLRFALDDNNNNVADYVRFFSGSYATVSVRPTLIIEYQVP